MFVKKIEIEAAASTEKAYLRRKLLMGSRKEPGRRQILIMLEDIALDMENPANLRLAAIDLLCQTAGYAKNRVTRNGKGATALRRAKGEPARAGGIEALAPGGSGPGRALCGAGRRAAASRIWRCA